MTAKMPIEPATVTRH